jgi:phosphoribosyl 1,2-cyclic phosphodiesterase
LQTDRAEGITVRFWGVRGTIPTPGPDTCRYGGNTACVEVRAYGELLILDAGTGIRKLGQALSGIGKPIQGTLLISHAHWDHIQGLPFFAPAMTAGNRFHVYGSMGSEPGMRSILTGQMESPHFPLSLDDLPDTLEFHELQHDAIQVGGVKVSTLPLHHPGRALGFRVEASGRAVVYATDQEPLAAVNGGEPTLDPRLHQFATGANLLICDAQYTAEEYRRHVGWGHSSVIDAVRLALAARVERLALFHYDPERDDAAVDRLLQMARDEVSRRHGQLDIVAAAEGLELAI